MNRYIVLLRGINVSGKNKIPMAELRELLNILGFQNVETYIQSGNIVLDAHESKIEVCNKVHLGIKEKFGFEIPVLARTPEEWKKAIDKYPFPIENEKIVAFSFLNKVPEQKELEVKGLNEDQYKVVNDVVYLYCPSSFANTKLTNNTIEKKLAVIATTRNYKTTIKILELATKS